jgi:hypothetical protein
VLTLGLTELVVALPAAWGGPKGMELAVQHADAITYCLGPNPEIIWTGPPRAGQGCRRSRPALRVGHAGEQHVGLPAAAGGNLEGRRRPRLGSGPINSCIVNSGRLPTACDTPLHDFGDEPSRWVVDVGETHSSASSSIIIVGRSRLQRPWDSAISRRQTSSA